MEQKKLERKGCGDGKGGDDEEEKCVLGDVNSLVENYCVKEIVVTRQNYAGIHLEYAGFVMQYHFP